MSATAHEARPVCRDERLVEELVAVMPGGGSVKRDLPRSHEQLSNDLTKLMPRTVHSSSSPTRL